MHRSLLLAGHLAALTGCGAPGTGPLPPASVPTLAVRFEAPELPESAEAFSGRFTLQAVMTAYTTSAIDHVKLSLHRLSGGVYVPVAGVVKRVPRASLSAPVVLRGLKLATDYRITAEAFSSADESQEPISIPQNSVTDFRTPSVIPNGQGVASAENAISVGSFALRLKDQTYYGTHVIHFTASLLDAIPSSTRRVDIKLERFGGGSWTSLTTWSTEPEEISDGLTLRKLRYGTSYRVTFNGYKSNGQASWSPNVYRYTFSMPSPSGGQVETETSTTMAVPPFSPI